jgi:biopolymer transport protein ExbD
MTPIWQHRLPTKAGGSLLLLGFVDITMLLLVFLVVGSGYMMMPAVEVEPPEVANPVNAVVPKLVINLNKQGDLYFNYKAIEDWDALKTELSAVKAQSTETPAILLRADKEADYQAVVQILAITRQYGMRVFLWTEPETR